MAEHLAAKYGITIEQAKANTQQVARMAKDAGLEFNMDTIILTNTFDAHRLMALANKNGLAHEMKERILKAHFTESKHIGDHDTLVALAEEVGLDPQEAREVLQSDQYSEDVHKDINEARQIGINSVPFFLIDGKYSLTGAQPTETFVQAIRQIKDGTISKRLI